jgi:formate hydrogenlyase subunit 6/NADH:ubiquinone oxidoreductase subunit I
MYQVNINDCSGCESCVDICPTEAISMVDGHTFIDIDECLECGSCIDECPEGAIVEID